VRGAAPAPLSSSTASQASAAAGKPPASPSDCLPPVPGSYRRRPAGAAAVPGRWSGGYYGEACVLLPGNGDQLLADVADGGVGEGQVDGEVELVALQHGLVGAVAGQVDGAVVQELRWSVLPGCNEPVPVWCSGVGPVLEGADDQPSGQRVGDVP
jgi:hypothetical protein